MPNWCYQRLNIRGDQQERDRFVALVKTETGYQLTSLYPCPQELLETVKGFTNDEDVQRQRDEQRQRNIEKYGYPDWYEWSYANWDSKWSDCETDLLDSNDTETEFQFESAWSPMCGLIAKLSAMFPSLVFGLSYTEEANFFAGWSLFHQGSIVCSHDHPIDHDACPDWETDPEGSTAWHDDIRDNHDRLLYGAMNTLLLKD